MTYQGRPRTGTCYSGHHEVCVTDWCGCSCHGDEPPAGVREPRRPPPDAPSGVMEMEEVRTG
jgi:hypothetical protein